MAEKVNGQKVNESVKVNTLVNGQIQHVVNRWSTEVKVTVIGDDVSVDLVS
jgi:hypothetical protein